ncbi:hypothetical protein IIA29_02860 [candidate division KSB1 bacterium]|nr:hypothetical protein [candidate division KSB1 bacterium]
MNAVCADGPALNPGLLDLVFGDARTGETLSSLFGEQKAGAIPREW